MAKNIDFMGATFPDVPSIRLPQHEGGLVSFTDVTDTTAVASDVASGKYFYTADGEKTVGTASGGITPSGTMSITSNGIYDIVSFASVDVQVSGGGGGDHDAEDGIIARNISGAYENSRVRQIGNYAFNGCSYIATVDFPNVQSIGASAFQSCFSLTTATFPNATTIGSYAFTSCSSLTTISFPEATSVGSYAFRNCRNLSEAIFPQVSSNRLYDYAFCSCSQLTKVEFSKLRNIKSYVFMSCYRLTTVIMPSASEVGGYAFQYCSALSTISLPALSSRILGSAFQYCSSLMSVYLLGSKVPQLLASNAFSSTPMANSTYTGSFGSIYVPASLVDSYKSASNWSYYSARITSYTE